MDLYQEIILEHSKRPHHRVLVYPRNLVRTHA